MPSFRDLEVVHPDGFRIFLGTQFTATVLEVLKLLRLFGGRRDCRLARGNCRSLSRIDMLELSIVVRVVAPLPCPATGWVTEVQLPQ